MLLSWLIELTSIHLEFEASYLHFKEPLALKNQCKMIIMLQLDPIFCPLDDNLLKRFAGCRNIPHLDPTFHASFAPFLSNKI